MFGGLPEFEEAFEQKPVVEAAALDAAAIFRKHGVTESVGLSMLHKHFKLNDDEILVETPVGNMSFIRPAASVNVKSGYLPYMFRLVESTDGFLLAPLEYAPISVIDSGIFGAFVSNTRFINEIGELIRKCKGLDVVGVTLLHRNHIIDCDGGSIEFTDHDKRELVVVPTSQAPTYQANYIGENSFTTRTIWTFGERKGQDDCTHCRHCYGHSTY